MIVGIQHPLFGLKQHEGSPLANERRLSHTVAFGNVGTGKTTALARFAIEDIAAGAGVIFLDTTGEATRLILPRIPAERRQDAILFNAADTEHPFGLNLFDDVRDPALAASTLVRMIHAAWPSEGSSPLLDLNLRTAALAMIETGGTMISLPFLFTSRTYRTRVIGQLAGPLKRHFRQYDKMDQRQQDERAGSILNRMMQIATDPLLANILGQSRTTLDLKDITQAGKILIVRLPRSELSEERVRLLGNIVLSLAYEAAMARRNAPPLHLYLDDAWLLDSPALPSMLAGLRQKGVSVNMAAHYLDQFSRETRAAILGTVGTILCFQVSPIDQETLGRLFEIPAAALHNLVTVPFGFAFARYDGRTHFLDMPAITAEGDAVAPRRIRNRSRRQFGRPRASVEKLLGALNEPLDDAEGRNF